MSTKRASTLNTVLPGRHLPFSTTRASAGSRVYPYVGPRIPPSPDSSAPLRRKSGKLIKPQVVQPLSGPEQQTAPSAPPSARSTYNDTLPNSYDAPSDEQCPSPPDIHTVVERVHTILSNFLLIPVVSAESKV